MKLLKRAQLYSVLLCSAIIGCNAFQKFKLLRQFPSQGDQVLQLVLSADGKRLAYVSGHQGNNSAGETVDYDAVIVVLDYPSGNIVHTIKDLGSEFHLSNLNLSPEGTLLFYSERRGSYLVSIVPGGQTRTLSATVNRGFGATPMLPYKSAFSRDGHWLALAESNDVAIFDLTSNAEPVQFKCEALMDIVFLPDNRSLLLSESGMKQDVVHYDFQSQSIVKAIPMKSEIRGIGVNESGDRWGIVLTYETTGGAGMTRAAEPNRIITWDARLHKIVDEYKMPMDFDIHKAVFNRDLSGLLVGRLSDVLWVDLSNRRRIKLPGWAALGVDSLGAAIVEDKGGVSIYGLVPSQKT